MSCDTGRAISLGCSDREALWLRYDAHVDIHLATWLFSGKFSYCLALPESGAGKPPIW